MIFLLGLDDDFSVFGGGIRLNFIRLGSFDDDDFGGLDSGFGLLGSNSFLLFS